MAEREVWVAELKAIARNNRGSDRSRAKRMWQIAKACHFPDAALGKAGRFVADPELIPSADAAQVGSIAALLYRVADDPPVDLKLAIASLAARMAILVGLISRTA
jgi:hypothetical protein